MGTRSMCGTFILIKSLADTKSILCANASPIFVDTLRNVYSRSYTLIYPSLGQNIDTDIKTYKS